MSSLMTRFEIWCEGYIATGERSGATLLGAAEGLNFQQACDELAITNLHFAKFYDREKLTYWGCKLFPTLDEARKTFG